MNELRILAKVGPFSVTPYGLMLVLAALAGGGLTCLLWHRRMKKPLDGALLLTAIVSLMAILGGRIVYCATMAGSFIADYEEQGGALYMLQLWEGGYALYGAVLFGLLGAWLFARAAKLSFGAVADILAPGAALAICIGRAAEYFTLEGIGTDVENEALQFFPVAMEAEEGWWVMPIFAWEAIAALVIAVVLLLLKDRYPGWKAETFIILLGMTQIMMDSLRKDEYIRFGFVHFNQLAAAITSLAVVLLRVRRQLKNGGSRRWQILRLAIFFLCALVIIGIEFGLDKSTIDNLTLYIIMAVTLIVMGWAAQTDRIGGKKEC